MLIFENGCYNCMHSDVCEKKRQFEEIERKLKGLEISLAGSDEVELTRLEEINWVVFKVTCLYNDKNAFPKRKDRQDIVRRNEELLAKRRKMKGEA